MDSPFDPPLFNEPRVEKDYETPDENWVIPADEPVVEKSRKEFLHEEIQKILAEHGSEPNIGTNHVYWKYLNEYRGL